MFRRAAIGQPNYLSGEPFWPTYALLTHAAELALKAFARHRIEQGSAKPKPEPAQHDLLGWYCVALEYGLEEQHGMMEDISTLNALHLGHPTRYPSASARSLPDASTIADRVVDHLIDKFTAVINPR
jgi:hypothetical protein